MAEMEETKMVGYQARLEAEQAEQERESDEARWRMTEELAQALGIDLSEGWTYDRINDDIADLLPVGCTQDDAAVALQRVLLAPPANTMWVLYRLGGLMAENWTFTPFEHFDYRDEAVRRRDYWLENDDLNLYVLIEQTTTVTRKAIS